MPHLFGMAYLVAAAGHRRPLLRPPAPPGRVVLWSARLVHHALGTNTRPVEQKPYLRWRTQFVKRWWSWSYVQVFLLQGGLIWTWALPLVLAIHAPRAGVDARRPAPAGR